MEFSPFNHSIHFNRGLLCRFITFLFLLFVSISYRCRRNLSSKTLTHLLSLSLISGERRFSFLSLSLFFKTKNTKRYHYGYGTQKVFFAIPVSPISIRIHTVTIFAFISINRNCIVIYPEITEPSPQQQEIVSFISSYLEFFSLCLFLLCLWRRLRVFVLLVDHND